jgi:hypothetical protein
VVGERYHAFLFQTTQPACSRLCAVILGRKRQMFARIAAEAFEKGKFFSYKDN